MPIQLRPHVLPPLNVLCRFPSVLLQCLLPCRFQTQLLHTKLQIQYLQPQHLTT